MSLHLASPDQLLTVGQLASRWQVNPYTIRQWAREGIIDGAQKLRPGLEKSPWRFRHDSRIVETPAQKSAGEAYEELRAWRPRRAA